MRANRIDANQPEIVAHFREWDCSVLVISDLKNCCDIIVAKHGRTIAVEIKDGAKVKSARKLTDGEEAFKASWKGCWRLCESIKDADKIISELNSVDTIPTR